MKQGQKSQSYLFTAADISLIASLAPSIINAFHLVPLLGAEIGFRHDKDGSALFRFLSIFKIHLVYFGVG